jgi:transcription-repair coupling factor (superfamily II helicase)
MPGLVSAGYIEAIASAPGVLNVASTPEGLEAAAFAQGLFKRGGVGLFIARDESRAQAFGTLCRMIVFPPPPASLPPAVLP